MGVFTWSSVYETGVQPIDVQHRMLMDMVNEMFEALVLDGSELILDSMLLRLTRYAQRHFSYEEALLERGGDPGLAAHRVEHRELLQRVIDLRTERTNGLTGTDEATLELLCEWLTEHIRDTDGDHSRYMRAGLSTESAVTESLQN